MIMMLTKSIKMMKIIIYIYFTYIFLQFFKNLTLGNPTCSSKEFFDYLSMKCISCEDCVYDIESNTCHLCCPENNWFDKESNNCASCNECSQFDQSVISCNKQCAFFDKKDADCDDTSFFANDSKKCITCSKCHLVNTPYCLQCKDKYHCTHTQWYDPNSNECQDCNMCERFDYFPVCKSQCPESDLTTQVVLGTSLIYNENSSDSNLTNQDQMRSSLINHEDPLVLVSIICIGPMISLIVCLICCCYKSTNISELSAMEGESLMDQNDERSNSQENFNYFKKFLTIYTLNGYCCPNRIINERNNNTTLLRDAILQTSMHGPPEENVDNLASNIQGENSENALGINDSTLNVVTEPRQMMVNTSTNNISSERPVLNMREDFGQSQEMDNNRSNIVRPMVAISPIRSNQNLSDVQDTELRTPGLNITQPSDINGNSEFAPTVLSTAMEPFNNRS